MQASNCLRWNDLRHRRGKWGLIVAATLWLMPAAAHADRNTCVGFGDLERQLIVAYYETQQAVVRYLPNESEAVVRRGERLADEHTRDRLPGVLEARLPVLPRGYERVVVSGRVVLLHASTRTVRDVLPDIIVSEEDRSD
jgi:hypothetical protein